MSGAETGGGTGVLDRPGTEADPGTIEPAPAGSRRPSESEIAALLTREIESYAREPGAARTFVAVVTDNEKALDADAVFNDDEVAGLDLENKQVKDMDYSLITAISDAEREDEDNSYHDWYGDVQGEFDKKSADADMGAIIKGLGIEVTDESKQAVIAAGWKEDADGNQITDVDKVTVADVFYEKYLTQDLNHDLAAFIPAFVNIARSGAGQPVDMDRLDQLLGVMEYNLGSFGNPETVVALIKHHAQTYGVLTQDKATKKSYITEVGKQLQEKETDSEAKGRLDKMKAFVSKRRTHVTGSADTGSPDGPEPLSSADSSGREGELARQSFEVGDLTYHPEGFRVITALTVNDRHPATDPQVRYMLPNGHTTQRERSTIELDIASDTNRLQQGRPVVESLGLNYPELRGIMQKVLSTPPQDLAAGEKVLLAGLSDRIVTALGANAEYQSATAAGRDTSLPLPKFVETAALLASSLKKVKDGQPEPKDILQALSYLQEYRSILEASSVPATTETEDVFGEI